MSKVEQAVSCFKEGFSCSQAVCATYCPDYGLDRVTGLKVSSAFGGGMAHLGQTCGAVTGALMVIGLRYGRTRADDLQAKERTNSIGRDFVEKFKAKNGSILCKELLGHDFSTPEGAKVITEQKLPRSLCPAFIKDAAEILEQIL